LTLNDLSGMIRVQIPLDLEIRSENKPHLVSQVPNYIILIQFLWQNMLKDNLIESITNLSVGFSLLYPENVKLFAVS